MKAEKSKNQKSRFLLLAVVGLIFMWTTRAWSQADDVIDDPPICTGYLDPKNCVGLLPLKPFPKFDCVKNPELHHCVGSKHEYPSKIRTIGKKQNFLQAKFICTVIWFLSPEWKPRLK